jgi:hypothetical protein
MSEREKHYLLIIHGTWSTPTPESTKWHQKGGAFADALAQRLEGTPLAGAVWRSCGGTATEFYWTGDNTHGARVNAAKALYKEILSIRATDPTARIHFIAHSHGGNVLLKALELYRAKLESDGEKLASAMRFDQEKYDPPREPDRQQLGAELAKHFPDWSEAHRDEIQGVLTNDLSKLTYRRLFYVWGWFSSDPRSHRIGRLVFLGTPFLRKRWYRHQWRNRLRMAAQISSASTVIYLVMLILSGAFAMLSSTNFVGFSPLNWPIVLDGLLLGFVATVLIPITVNGGRLFDVGNIYYQPEYRRSSRPRIETLVVSAAHLDEALLAHSAEPLVDAYLAPEIDKLTNWTSKWRSAVRPSGIPLAEFDMRAFAFLFLTISNVLRLAANSVLAPLRPILRAYLRRFVRRLMFTQATGLPSYELDGATISVRTDIGDEAFVEGKVWNVAELAASAPSLLPPRVDKERYAFLWLEGALNARLGKSSLWQQVGKHQSALERERGHDLDDQERAALQRACLVIEERAGEFSGAVQLTHSGYYGHPVVLDAIVAFLVAGQRPQI